ncbi:hypothetical protein [Glaciibacter psychrotolerans]|uniref:Uncharacterized protein n=1 Tax=Glaciibacter psychrotolerans TaxID=670054 RepID=A0A7Z0EFC5_9MICO|nr:hypothetical protein [Leifsonia psychrotolerans]NYJ20576.1 hypothetical protein [Leifsonia psychrotolerans]
MSFAKPHKHEHLEHRGNAFTLERGDSNRWVITDLEGVVYGSIVMIERDGADHDPVYNGYLAGQTDFLHFGSDWDGIARALINDFVAEHTPPHILGR